MNALHARRRQRPAESFDDELEDLRRRTGVSSHASHTRHPMQASADTRLRVHAAASAWMLMIFGVCYIAVPVMLAVVGLYGALSSFLFNAIAFAFVAPAVLFGLEVLRPKLDLDRTTDPVLPVAAGSFMTWALLHNTLPFLRPFSDFYATELAAFIALNGLEAMLFAMLLATFVRSRAQGFAVGVGLQLTFASVFVGTLLLIL